MPVRALETAQDGHKAQITSFELEATMIGPLAHFLVGALSPIQAKLASNGHIT